MKNSGLESSKQELLDKNIKENALAKFGVRRPHTIFVAIMITLVLGIFAFTSLKVDLLPNMNLPYVLVISSIEMKDDGKTPKTEEPLSAVRTQEYTASIENRIQTVSGVKEIQSISNAYLSIIVVELNSNVNTDFAANDISRAVDMVDYRKAEFVKPMLMKLDPNMMPIFTFSTEYQSSTVEAESIEWYKSVFIPTIKRVTGVADVSSSLDSNDSFSYYNGKFSFSFSINKASDIATTEAVKNVIEALDKISSETSGAFTYHVTNDQGEYINQSIGSVLNNLLIGGILCIIILFLFLRNIKLTLAVAISIPLSIIGTFVFMYFMGIGLNIVSMGGLALAVGMLVDNSVIIMENIYRLKTKGLSIKDAAIKGASQILGAILAATLTTICMFFPMFFLEGLLIEVFIDLVWVIILSLLASLIIAIAFLPTIITAFNKDKVSTKVKKIKTPNKLSRGLTKTKDGVNAFYNKALRWSIKNKFIMLGITVVVLVGSVLLALTNGFVLMPATDEGEFSANISINSLYGATIDMTDPMKPSVDINQTAISELSDAIANGGIDNGITYTSLYELTKATLGSDLDSVAITYSDGSGTMSILNGSGAGINLSVKLIAKRKVSTAKASENLYLAIVDYIENNNLTEETTDPMDIVFGIDRTIFAKDVSVSASGSMSSFAVSDSVTITLAGDILTGETADDTNARINTALVTIQNKIIDKGIKGILKFENDYNPTTITQVNKKVAATLSIVLEDGVSISKVQSKIDEVVDGLFKDTSLSPIFTGVTQVENGFAAQMNETVTQMALAMLVGLLLIYLVLVAIFRSFKTPFIMLITVPIAFTGGFLLLFICGMPLSIVALIGFLILMGVITNNGIVLIDYVNQSREDGLSVNEALIAAANTRTRPVLMNALSTIFAMIPMALAFGAGSGMMAPMAIVTIGGLIYGTFMTLLVAPAFYAMFNRDKKQKLLGIQACLPPAEVLALPEPEETVKQKPVKKKTKNKKS